MAAGLIEGECVTQYDQIEDVKEYILFLRTLNENEKREFRGMIKGMQVMKDMMHSGVV